MNVILLGYRGSGKSTIGKLLASALQRPFVDVDDVIRARYDGQSIAEIWAEFGEPHFRKTECRVTAELCGQEEQVIALGGGTAMQPEARAVLEQADAMRVYLQASAEVLAERICSDAMSSANRPSLLGRSGSAGEVDEVRVVLAQREPVYRAVADHVVDVGQWDPAQVTQQIIELIPNAAL